MNIQQIYRSTHLPVIMSNCPEMKKKKQRILVEQPFGAHHFLFIQTPPDNTIIRAPLNTNNGPCLQKSMLMDRKQILDAFLLIIAFRLLITGLAAITEATHSGC